MATAKYSALFPHVAPRSRELLHILVHGAANLPKIDGRIPRCYVTAQSRTNLATQDVGEIINATNIVQDISPQWNEMIYAEISDDNSDTEEIIIFVIEESRQLNIVQHRLSWRWFEPFYQYHLNLQYPLTKTSQTACLYVSIMHKLSSLSKENIRYFGLETLLDSFDVPLSASQSIYAVARIVPNYKSYKNTYLRNSEQHRLGIEFKKIITPNEQDFIVPDFFDGGYPQVSLASKQSKIPIWKYDFLFSHEHEKDNMFITDNAAVVIEFYPYQNISNNTNWRISGLLGWTAILLDGRSQIALQSSGATKGMRTEGLLVESEGDLTADNAKYLTSEVVLRLINEKHPAKNLLMLYGNDLPILPSYNDEANRKNNIEPVYIQVPGSKKSFFPEVKSPPTATPPKLTQPIARSPAPPVAQPTFLPPQVYQPPQYEIIPPVQQVQQVQNADVRYHIPRINPYDLDDIPTEYRAMLATNYPPRRDEDIDGWFDYFQREVAIYKQAIRRIIQDVIQLRDQHKTLTTANNDLRTKIENFEKKKKVLYQIFEGDKIDKDKIQDIFNRLNAKISAQSLEIKENYAKINSYEKELARRSELRAQYDALVRNSQAREIEIKLMKDRINKADGLEETVRRQEMVIEKLEGMINNYMKQKRSGGTFNDTDRNFLSEHAALGLETQQLQRRIPVGRHTAMTNSHQEDLLQQNLTYQQELANLNARFQENVSAWGREKADLLSRLDDLEQSTTTPRTRKSKN